MRSESSTTTTTKKKITTVRDALLTVHQTLLEAVRIGYERANGRISGPFELLELAANDEAFAWLRPLSQLIVAFDEASPFEGARAAQAFVEPLFVEPSDFLERYVETMQAVPDVVFANAALRRALAALTPVARAAVVAAP